MGMNKSMLGAFLGLGFIASEPVFAQSLVDELPLVPEPVLISTPGYICTSGVAREQFDVAFSSSYLLVYQAWASSGMQRNDVSSFVQKAGAIATGNVSEGLALLDPVSNPRQNTIGCRFWGSLSGVMEGVADVLEMVIVSCSMDGAYYADFVSPIYCELAETFGPLVPPTMFQRETGVCSSAFESTCDEVFDRTTDQYTTGLGNRCADLRVGDYAPGYDAIKFNSCTYKRVASPSGDGETQVSLPP